MREQSAKDKDSDVKAKVTNDPEYDKLLSLHTQLKSDIAAVVDENKELASTLSRLRIQSKKWEVSRGRTNNKSLASEASAKELGLAETTSTSLSVSFLSQLEKGERTASDLELQEMLEEYRYVQEMRRSFRRRIDGAKATLQAQQAVIASEQDKFTKFTQFVTGGSRSASQADSEDSEEERKASLLRKIDEAKIELLRIHGAVELGISASVFDDSIAELTASVSFLKESLAEESKSLELVEYERDVCREKLMSLRDDSDGAREEWRDKTVGVRNDIIKKRIGAALPPMPTFEHALY
jgi:hypothetical protein